MAETQTTPVANTTNEEKKLYVYYYSDPDAVTPELRFHAIYTDVPFNELPWRVHTEKPDESLKDPVWNNQINGWVENAGDAQAQILAKTQNQIADLVKTKNDLEKDIQTVQATQGAATQQSLALTKSLQAVNENQENTAKLMASMQTIMLGIKSQLDAQQTAKPQTTPATQPTTPAANNAPANN